MDYTYKCKECGQEFAYKVANHSIEIIEKGKKLLKACRGEIVRIEIKEKKLK